MSEKIFLLEVLSILDLELLHTSLAIENDEDDSEDQSLIELAGEILEESLLEDIKPERLEFPGSVLFLGAFLDGVLTAVEEESGFILLADDVEVADFVLTDRTGPEGSLDGRVGFGTFPRASPGLGALPRESPIMDGFGTELTLSIEIK